MWFNDFLQILNDNSGAVLAVLTLLYLLATLLIWLSNSKAARATTKQVKVMQQQFEESNRPFVIPKFDVVEGSLQCLVFENKGNQFANNIKITFNQEWIDLKSKLGPFESEIRFIDSLKAGKLFLAPNDKIYYGYAMIANGTTDIIQLMNQLMIIDIEYTNNASKKYSEHYELDLTSYSGGLANTSDFLRMSKKRNAKLDDIKKEIKNITGCLNSKFEVLDTIAEIMEANLTPTKLKALKKARAEQVATALENNIKIQNDVVTIQKQFDAQVADDE